MPKPQYGNAHQQARRDALAQFKDGMPCWRCRRPMHAWQRLDLDHVRPVALGGMRGMTRLVHAYCNRSAGASMGNRMRKQSNSKSIHKAQRHSLPQW